MALSGASARLAVIAASSLKWKQAMAAATHSATGASRISAALMLWSSKNSSTRPLRKHACRPGRHGLAVHFSHVMYLRVVTHRGRA